MLGPATTPSGCREYTNQDVDRLVFVKTAQHLGFAPAEVAETLASWERGEPPCTDVLGVLGRQVDDLDRRIADLEALRPSWSRSKPRPSASFKDETCYCSVIEHATENLTSMVNNTRRERSCP